MTCDIVALVHNQPDVHTVVEGMVAFGEPIEPQDIGDGATHLLDREGRLLVSIEAPVLVLVPGEAERLLGPEMAAAAARPSWWVEVRATAGLPDAERLARGFAERLVHWQGGAVWPQPSDQAIPGGPPPGSPAPGAG